MLLSLKQIGTICLAVLISIFSVSSFADNITTSPADCTQPTLSVDTGTANLNAQWEANNIKIRWYNNNTLMESGDNTCTYDTSFATAGTSSTMTRTGYEFKGWRVRPEMDFSSLYYTINAGELWAIDVSSGKNKCWYTDGNGDGVSVSCNVAFSDLAQSEWKVYANSGTIYGMAKCSETSGATMGEIKNISDTEGGYCWCKATGYKSDSGNGIMYGPDATMSWVYRSNYSTSTNCQGICAMACAKSYRNGGTGLFRRNILGVN